VLRDLFPSFIDEYVKLAFMATSSVDGRENGTGGIPRPKAPTQASIRPLANKINTLNRVGMPQTPIGVNRVKL